MVEPIVEDARQAAHQALKNLETGVIKVRIPRYMLDNIIRVIYDEESSYNTRRAFTRMKKLFDALDLSVFKPEEKDRVWIIRSTIGIYLKHDIMSRSMFRYEIEQLPDSDEERLDILDKLVFESSAKPGDDRTARYTYQFCENLLAHGYACAYKEAVEKLSRCIDFENPNTFSEIEEDLDAMARAIIQLRSKTKMTNSQKVFSLQEDIFHEVVVDTVNAAKRQDGKYYTGLKALNSMLGGGFFNKRVYYFIGLPGGGKSKMLLNCALWIKKYNRVKPSAPGRRPTIVFVTMENEIDETVERMFNITSSNSSIANYTPDQVCGMLRNKGKLTIEDEDDMDIYIRYYRHKEIDTVDLYGLMDELEDEGRDPKVLILDYIKRIRPSVKGRDEKEDLKNVTDDLKDFAVSKNMAVITAHQLNRSAEADIAMARLNREHNLVEKLSSAHIGTAWEVNENADAIMFLQDEERDTENYVGLKLSKIRYSPQVDEDAPKDFYLEGKFNKMYHRYAEGSTIRLMDDVGTGVCHTRFTLNPDETDLSDRKDTTKIESKKLAECAEYIEKEEKRAQKKEPPKVEKPKPVQEVPVTMRNIGVTSRRILKYEDFYKVTPNFDINPNKDVGDDMYSEVYIPQSNYSLELAAHIGKGESEPDTMFTEDLTGMEDYSGAGRRAVTDNITLIDNSTEQMVVSELNAAQRLIGRINLERCILGESIADDVNARRAFNEGYENEEIELVDDGEGNLIPDPYEVEKRNFQFIYKRDEFINQLVQESDIPADEVEDWGGVPEIINPSANEHIPMKFKLIDPEFRGKKRDAVMIIDYNKDHTKVQINGVDEDLIYHDEINVPVVIDGVPLCNVGPSGVPNRHEDDDDEEEETA